MKGPKNSERSRFAARKVKATGTFSFRFCITIDGFKEITIEQQRNYQMIHWVGMNFITFWAVTKRHSKRMNGPNLEYFFIKLKMKWWMQFIQIKQNSHKRHYGRNQNQIKQNSRRNIIKEKKCNFANQVSQTRMCLAMMPTLKSLKLRN